MKYLSCVLVVLSFCFFSAQASAYTRPTSLSKLASVFAMRPVQVRCYEEDETDSPASTFAWGYVLPPAGKATYEAIDATLCRDVLSVNDATLDPGMRALGILVIVHEAYHLRRWGASANEAKVECQAIRHWKVAARLGGASEETVTALWSYALALHAEETRIFDFWTQKFPYYEPGCQVPPVEPRVL